MSVPIAALYLVGVLRLEVSGHDQTLLFMSEVSHTKKCPPFNGILSTFAPAFDPAVIIT